MDKKTTLTYLKGYLEAIATMNTFANDGKTYDIELLPKIDNDFQKTLSNHLEIPFSAIEIENIEENWQDLLQRELHLYFNQIVVEVFRRTREKFNRAQEGEMSEEEINSIKNDSYFNIGGPIENFLQNLKKIITHDTKLFRVKIHSEVFYENYYNDYLFDFGDKVLFLHFGGSD